MKTERTMARLGYGRCEFDTQKAAKEAAERERVAGIRARINRLQQLPVECVGMGAEEIAAKLRAVESAVIDDAFAEFKGEAELARDAVVEKLNTMHRAAVAASEEAQRLAAERAELDRRQREEEERLAAERAAQEARLKAEREQQERELAEQRATQAEADRIAREAREAEERRLAEQRAELQRQQDEINAARAEQERKEREAREAAEAEECEVSTVTPQQSIEFFSANFAALLVEAVGHLRTLVTMAQRGQTRLPF